MRKPAEPGPLNRVRGGGSGRKSLQRRARRYRSYFIVILALTALAVTAAELVQYRTTRVWGSELYVLQTIRISGNRRIPTSEILDTLGLRVGETTMREVLPHRLEAALRNTFADIRTLQVRRDVPAGLITVTLTERQPVARIDVGGRPLAVDSEGVVLERPFGNTVADGKTEDADLIRSLPLLVGTFPLPTARQMPISDPAFQRALRTVRWNEAVSAARQGKDLLVIESVDASDPERIVVRFQPTRGRRITAWLRETLLREGLENLRHVYDHRTGTQSTVAVATASSGGRRRPASSAGRASSDRSSRESSRVETSLPSSSHPVGTASRVRSEERSRGRSDASVPATIEERYDARFSSTIYITSGRGGQDG